MKVKIKIKKAPELFETLELEEDSVYEIRVKTRADNPTHSAILFTGFKNGNYCMIYSNSYDSPVDMMSVYTMEVIKKLTTLK